MDAAKGIQQQSITTTDKMKQTLQQTIEVIIIQGFNKNDKLTDL